MFPFVMPSELSDTNSQPTVWGCQSFQSHLYLPEFHVRVVLIMLPSDSFISSCGFIQAS